MHEVAIIGAGELGGELAHVLARRDIARRIRLIDASGQIAAGKALDIMQAASIEQFSTVVSGGTDVFAAAAAHVIVLADRAGAGEWNGDAAFAPLQQIARSASRSIVVCAGAMQRETVERAIHELKFSRLRILGSAPQALAAAVRAMIALESNGSAREVGLTILGVPPANIVVPWEEATIGGFAATRVLDEPARRRIAARVAPLWPPGPYALAHAAAEAVAGVLGRSRSAISCFVASDKISGQRARVAALPVRLDERGVAKIELPALSVQAQVALDNAMLL